MAKSSAKEAANGKAKKKARREPSESAQSAASDEIDGSAFAESEADSDVTDEDSEEEEESDSDQVATPAKRKKAPSSKSSPKSKSSANKSTKVFDLVPAPKKTAPHGQLSKTTLEFLRGLKAENEREWLQRHDAVYRHGLTEWKNFVDALSQELSQVDWTLPVLPAKDLVHRLARDIRFSPDKTPYKTSFQASFSRTGRKGVFAGYFCMLEPGGHSLIAGGLWGPEKNELATIRTNILHNPKKLRRVIEAPEFVKMFGPARPLGPGKRQNIFGRDNELKNAPKLEGVTKEHPDIDLLKLKSFVVSKIISDKDMMAEDAVKKIAAIVAVMAPLVQHLNNLILPMSDAEDSSSSGEAESQGGE